MRFTRILLILLLASAASAISLAAAQEQDDQDTRRAESLIRDAIKARGGDAYLKVRTAVSQGQFTPFEKGASGLPSSFTDYLAYPDNERTEFGKGDRKFIQTNSGGAGWVYDAPQKMIRDQKEDQIKRFQQGNRFDLDNVLRRGWQEQGAKLVYVGRREVWHNTFSEAVRIEFADGASMTLHFDPRSKLPLMSEYKMVLSEATTNEQVRYFRWVDFSGVQFPTIQDFYREGQQSARVSFDSVSFNVSIPDKMFAKPANIKEVK